MSWFSDFASLVQRILTLSRELDQQRADIKELQTQVRDLTAIVRALARRIGTPKSRQINGTRTFCWRLRTVS